MPPSGGFFVFRLPVHETPALLLDVFLAPVLGQEYGCTTPGGSNLWSDNPPPECKDLDVQKLRRDGAPISDALERHQFSRVGALGAERPVASLRAGNGAHRV